MLEAVKRESPALTPLFWMGYCQHQPFVLFRTDEAYAIILSKQGAKMGCRFGSYAFDITVHPAYEQLNREFKSTELKAATDDLSVYDKYPALLGEMNLRIDELMYQHAGVKANSAKS